METLAIVLSTIAIILSLVSCAACLGLVALLGTLGNKLDETAKALRNLPDWGDLDEKRVLDAVRRAQHDRKLRSV